MNETHYIGRHLNVIIDRPLGSFHPTYDYEYPIIVFNPYLINSFRTGFPVRNKFVGFKRGFQDVYNAHLYNGV